MNRIVTLAAEGIDVTASNAEQARRYMIEDATEFRRDWNYTLQAVDATDDQLTEGRDDVSVEVEIDDAQGEGERTWNGKALFQVVVAPQDHDMANAAALAIVRG